MGTALIIAGLSIVFIGFVFAVLNFKKNFRIDRDMSSADVLKGFGKHLTAMLIVVSGFILAAIGVVLSVAHHFGG